MREASEDTVKSDPPDKVVELPGTVVWESSEGFNGFGQTRSGWVGHGNCGIGPSRGCGFRLRRCGDKFPGTVVWEPSEEGTVDSD